MKKYLLCLFLFFPLKNQAQNFSSGFSFYIPPRDTTAQPFLPAFPARGIDADEFVTIDANGHFAVKGQRIRFWGTNAAGDGAFPTLDRAWYVAGHLRKMGFNLVRFHHMDNPWGGLSLFEANSDTRHLNPANLSRVEKYISELKKNGIYANINLHVSRTVNARDGIADADSIQEYGKAVSYFDPQLLPLYKEYARQLLTHVSPYTGLSLVDDPVMAMVEITNENSLYRWWRDGMLKPFADGGNIMTRHSKMLDDQWLVFLREEYATTDNLRSAWNEGARDGDAIELVRDGTFEKALLIAYWQMEQHETAKAGMAMETSQPFEGSFCARLQVTASDGIDWHLQWKQVGLSVSKDSLYTVRFAARAAQNQKISVSVMRDTSPWTWYGGGSFQLTGQWQVFGFSFRAPESVDRIARLSFSIGEQAGTLWFDDIHLNPASVSGLETGESLEAGNVRRLDYAECVRYSDNRVKDMSAFYLKLQDDFFAEMRRYLKNELGVRVPVVGTNWNIGPADLAVQDKLDYIDNHAYWDHPQFPNIPWSSTDWYINNTPMVQDAYGGAVARLVAGVPSIGKPFTISEYNHPFPNHYQSEGVLFLAAYGAFHDADGVMLFDYGGSGSNYETDFIDGYFGIQRNTAMMALMPACAFAFRQGLIEPAQQSLELSFSRDDILLLPKNDHGNWQGPQMADPLLALQHAVRNKTFTSAQSFQPASLPPAPASPFLSDTRQLLWDVSGLFQVVTPQQIGFTGVLDKFTGRQLGPLSWSSASGFATGTWTSLTGQPLNRADRSLIVLSTRTQNSGMVWDGTTTIHDHWGSAPTLMQPAHLRLNLIVEADSIRVYPLSTTGGVVAEGTTYFPKPGQVFDVDLDQGRDRTVWYGVERYASASRVDEEPDRGLSRTFSLEQNYPNPFPAQRGATTINYMLDRETRIQLTVFDMLGRTIRRLRHQRQGAGSHTAVWDGLDDQNRPAPAGIYFYRLEYGDGGEKICRQKKLVLLR